MPKQLHTTNKGTQQSKQQNKNRVTPPQSAEAPEQVALLDEQGNTTAGNLHQAQVDRLGDPRLPAVQRQALAAKIGRVQGNRHLQRVAITLKKTSPKPQGESQREPAAAGATVQRNWFSDVTNFVGDVLNIRENEAALDLWEDYQDAKKELKAFKAKTHTAKNFQSTTRLGMFDATYKPAKGILEVVCKCQFNFINATAAEFPKAKPEELTWTDEKEKNQWKKNFLSTASSAWSTENPIFYCQKDWWESLTAKVVTKFKAVDADPHFVLNIKKIPKKEFVTSKVKRPKVKPDGTFTPGVGTFDTEDLEKVNKPGGKQVPAVHEAGHMLGLDDEYETGSKKAPSHSKLAKSEFGHGVARGADGRIMSGGSDIQPEHSVTFLAALKEATGMDEWTAAMCPAPKPIPPNPHTQGLGDYPLPSSDTRPA